MVKKYTVLGLYDDTGQTFMHHVAAKDEYEAIEEAAKYSDYNSELNIIGAVAGHIMLLTPGEDNTSSVYASNYGSEEDA